MAPLPVPASLTAPLAADALDDAIVANRTGLIAVTQAANTQDASLAALATRVATLEAATPATPTPVVTIAITAAQETALAAVGVGSVAILRGPTSDIVLMRQ